MCDSIKVHPIGNELRVHILVAKLLSEVKRLLMQYRHTPPVTNPNTAGRGGKHVNKCCSRRQTEVYALPSTTNIHIINICAFGEVIDVGGAVEDGVDRYIVEMRYNIREVGGDDAVDDKESRAEEVVEGTTEVIS